MRRVILVCGPPCAGKTTWVAQHARPGDIILDQDVIGAAAMRTALSRVTAMTAGTAWVIRCAPGPTRRQALARRLGADVVLLDPGEAEATARAAHRPHPRRHISAVRDWYRREAADVAPRKRGGRQPTPRGLTTAGRGYGWGHQQARAAALRRLRDGDPCTRCGQPMSRAEARLLDLDHTDDRAGYRGLAHAGCNRSAGQAKAQAQRHVTRRRVSRNSQAW